MAEEEKIAASPLRRTDWLPWLGVLWTLGLWLTITNPRPGLILSAALLVLIPLAVWFTRQESRSWVLPLTTFVLLLSSLAAESVLTISIWQYGVLLASGMLLITLLTNRRDPDDPFGTRAVNVAIALSMFFGWLVLLSFGIGIFFVWPWWWLAIGGGLLTGVSAVVLWSVGRIPWKKIRVMLPLIMVVGAEMMIATWWLPTVVYVGSIVAATALMLWFQVLRHVWQGSWEAGRARRYLLVGAGVISVTLLTARWN